MCRSGSAADTQNISAYIEHALQQSSMETDDSVTVFKAATLAQQILYNNKVRSAPTPRRSGSRETGVFCAE